MRIGIDLGGTKIEGIILDDAGKERERRRVPTPPGAYEEAVEAIAGVVAELERRVGARCTVGVARLF
jgi:fructokinase